MSTVLNPYITFDGNAREAMEFYKDVFGGELNMNTYSEFGEQSAEVADKIMHAALRTGGLTLMAADNPPGEPFTPGSTVTVSLSGEDDAELRGYWEKLSTGGTVTMPFEKQMWGDVFGMCIDRFGVAWMVNITAPEA